MNEAATYEETYILERKAKGMRIYFLMQFCNHLLMHFYIIWLSLL